ncbi:hypothetical protein PIB30_078816 [Stylosanthes scabra]|uniref:Myb-like domain-containing protein n=1 Tax=Stylosanthes scabra TaxID=79078 RepID=A0ABU6QRU3_9FABA|nr:hypothetical protein [Stylosanthes scabra]
MPSRIATATNNINNNMNLLFSSPSSSTDSDEGLEERYKKKRKWKDYFKSLTRQVLAKQEEMQNRFLEAIDKRERERVAQEESWRLKEMARIANEHDVLVQERSAVASKDAAVIALLHKLSDGRGHQTQSPPPQPQPPPQKQPTHTIIKPKNSSSSRWPKAEVHALIRLRTSLDPKYMENGPKGPLWEDISGGMQRLGYNRSAKRCKEKWENINKYFKKVKESNKQRREDSKTCPYFHELEALYKEKSNNNNFGSFQNNMEPLMVQPEQQWRPPPEPEEEGTSINNNNNASNEEEEEEYDDDGVLEEEDGDSVGEEEERGGGLKRYEIATNVS